MRLWTIGSVCLAMALPLDIHAQDLDRQDGDGLIKGAASYCDAKALGHIDDQIYVSADKWLHCMIVGHRCEHDPLAAQVDVRSSILSCSQSPFRRDYETERERFWQRHDALQSQCAAAIGGPCGFSTELLNDDQIAKIPGSSLSSPDPLP